MKSVMEEAPSIAKAIEQAWERVGKPREFTVKVFEEAKRSFFGFTKQSAKIALIFDERTLTEKPKSTQEKKTSPRQASSYTKNSTNAQDDRGEKQKQKFKKQHKSIERPQQEKTDKKNEVKSLWTDEMVNSARAWVAENLKIMGLPNIQFNTSTQKYYLRFQFDTCVLESKEKEKKLFSAFAHLIMATMRSKFKKEFRGLKVVLSSS
jgi:predicted RNA-binding protein Jag